MGTNRTHKLNETSEGCGIGKNIKLIPSSFWIWIFKLELHMIKITWSVNSWLPFLLYQKSGSMASFVLRSPTQNMVSARFIVRELRLFLCLANHRFFFVSMATRIKNMPSSSKTRHLAQQCQYDIEHMPSFFWSGVELTG